MGVSCEIQPARHNHQPTHQQGTEEACMAWPKLTKNANFGPNLVVFGQKILFFTGEIKNFVTYITENPPRPLFTLFFGQHWTKCAKNGNIWPNILIFMGVRKSFGTNITENYLDNLSALFFGQALDQMGQKCRYLAQNAKFGHFWAQNPFFWGWFRWESC